MNQDPGEPMEVEGAGAGAGEVVDPEIASGAKQPQKRFYRQRAHSNPLADHNFNGPTSPEDMDWSTIYPGLVPARGSGEAGPRVEFLDVGCGYGGMVVALGKMFPQVLTLGMEIRIKVADYVRDRIIASRSGSETGEYQNVGILRTNAMKYLPNYFFKGQLTKMFFLFPDPHFKKTKHKWRVINHQLLAEYAYVLGVGGIIYTITDVVDLHLWMVEHLEAHPLFERLTDAEVTADPIVDKLYESTEEGQKVVRNKKAGQNHGDGDVRVALFRKVVDPGL